MQDNDSMEEEDGFTTQSDESSDIEVQDSDVALGRSVNVITDDGASQTERKYVAGKDQEIEDFWNILGPPGNTTARNKKGVQTILKTDRDDHINIPEPVVDLFQKLGLNQRRFDCTLMEHPNGESNRMYVKSWSRTVPTIDYIALNYGPGKYTLAFSWDDHSDPNKPNNKHKKWAKIPITISDKYRDEYRAFKLRKKVADHRELQEKVLQNKIDAQIDNSLFGGETKSEESDMEKGRKYVQYIVESQRMLGLQQQNQQPQKSFDLEKILATVVPLVPAILSYMDNKAKESREMQNQLFMLMLSQNEKNNQSLIETMKAVKGPSSGSEMMRDTFDMIRDALDLKSMLTGDKKDGVLDRVMGMVESALPQIMQFAAMSAQQRQQNIMYQMAQTGLQYNKDLNAVRNDPELLSEMVGKLDTYYGWEQTDQILAVANIPRPEACVRTEQNRYPEGDPRNSITNAEVENEPDSEETANADTQSQG